jgi:hypothetical protein
MEKLKLNGKVLEIYSTSSWSSKYGQNPLLMIIFMNTLRMVLGKYPVDMLVFERKDGNDFSVRLAGYNFITNVLDETTIAYASELFPVEIERFWFKIDDYGDKYVGTFLFPSEY